jgi:hypothetical protein
MLITCVTLAFAVSPLVGHLADRGMPLLWSIAVLTAVGMGTVFAAQAVFSLKVLAATWVMQVGGAEPGTAWRQGSCASCGVRAWLDSRAVATTTQLRASLMCGPPTPASDSCLLLGARALQVVVTSFIGLILPLAAASGTRLYPAIARASGYNFAYNLSVGVLGGVSPLAISAIGRALEAAGHSATYGPAWWILAGGVGTLLACVAICWHSPHCNYTQTQWEKRQAAAERAREEREAKGAAAV